MNIRYTSDIKEEDAMILICTDASLANNEDCYSQGGYVMLMGSKETVLSSEIIQKYFKKCGKLINDDDMRDMLEECHLDSS